MVMMIHEAETRLNYESKYTEVQEAKERRRR